MATQQHLDGLPMQQDQANQYQQMQQDPNMHGMPGTEVPMDGDHANANSAGKVEGPSSTGGAGAAKDGTTKSKDKRERLRKMRSRACVACHTGKTRCSDTLPCQSCIKRGISNTCAYPDPLDNANNNADGSGAATSTPSTTSRRKSNQNQAQQQGQNVFSTTPHVRYYYEGGPGGVAGQQATTGVQAYPNGSAAAVIGPAAAIAASNAAMVRRDSSPSGGGRPSKKARYRNLTESEIATFQQPQTPSSSTAKTFKRGSFFVGDAAPVTIDPRLPLKLLLADEQNVDFFIGVAAVDGLPP